MLFIEAEEIDGTAYRWVVTDAELDRLVEILGEPETIRA
jgi:hypothetical protein